MKILILGFAKIKYMPYLNFYLNNIDCSQNEVHLLYWNRDLTEEPLTHLPNLTLHEFRLYQEDDVSPIKKIFSFIKYRRYASKVLAEGFDRIIALHTFPGLLLIDQLKKYYPERYIFDYRDKTYEHIGIFKRLIHQLVESSHATFVSSDGFRIFLPESPKIHTSHNLREEDLAFQDKTVASPIFCPRIRLAFWGFIRNKELNRILIEKVANDSRFELHYYGREQATAKQLKAYAATLTDRIFFHGEYAPEDRIDFVPNADLLHNLYEFENGMSLMANKYYDGILFRIPQLCVKNSYMGIRAEKAGVGICCDPYDENFLDQVYNYYRDLDRDQFNKKCDAELERILKEYRSGCEIIKQMTTHAKGC